MYRSLRIATVPRRGRGSEGPASATRPGVVLPNDDVVWVVVAEDNAEAIRRELMADFRWTACNLLLNRVAELLPLVSVVLDLAEPLP